MTRNIGAAEGRVRRAHPVHRPQHSERVGPLAPDDGERIEEQRPHFIGFIEPAPPYHPGPRRKLPAWAAHLRDLRHLKLVE